MTSRILVAYASKHGATREIAERIAATLTVAGQDATALPVEDAADLSTFDAIVIGGAAYYGSWLKEAAAFVRRNQSILATRPVWLFSSGPLGTTTADDAGEDPLAGAEPKEFAEFRETIKPRDLHVFFGALDPGKLNFAERVVRALPAGRGLLPEGDFRDWSEIEAWADSIATALLQPTLNGGPNAVTASDAADTGGNR